MLGLCGSRSQPSAASSGTRRCGACSGVRGRLQRRRLGVHGRDLGLRLPAGRRLRGRVRRLRLLDRGRRRIADHRTARRPVSARPRHGRVRPLAHGHPAGGDGLVWTDAPSLAVYGLSVVGTVVSSAFRPPRRRSCRAWRARRRADRLERTASTIESVEPFAGPALGGLLVAAFGIEVTFLVTAALLLWSAAMVIQIEEPEGSSRRSRRTCSARPRPGSGSSRRCRSRGSSAASSRADVRRRGTRGDHRRPRARDARHRRLGPGPPQLGVGDRRDRRRRARRGARRARPARVRLRGRPRALGPAARDRRARHRADRGAGRLRRARRRQRSSTWPATRCSSGRSTTTCSRVFGAMDGLMLLIVGLGAIVAPVLIDLMGVERASIVVGALLPALALLSWRALAGWTRRPPYARESSPARRADLRASPQPILESLAADREASGQGRRDGVPKRRSRRRVLRRRRRHAVALTRRNDAETADRATSSARSRSFATSRGRQRSPRRPTRSLLSLTRDDFLPVVTGHAGLFGRRRGRRRPARHARTRAV